VSAPAVVIGRLGRPHGIRGALRAQATGPTLALLRPGDEVEIHGPDAGAPPRRLRLESRQGTEERPILAFAGVATREDAAALTGATIRVPPNRLAPLPDPDTFFVSDLVGCEVLAGDRPLGPVTEVHSAPAHDVLEVAGSEGPVLIPFTADAVRDLDPAGRRIVVRPDLLDA
jgi:16S rRNA processing protein RimM